MNKHITILALILCCFLLGACAPVAGENPASQTTVTTGSSESSDSYSDNVSYPSLEPAVTVSQAGPPVYSHPDQTGDTVKLEIPAEKIVKIEFLGTWQMNIPTTKSQKEKGRAFARPFSLCVPA